MHNDLLWQPPLHNSHVWTGDWTVQLVHVVGKGTTPLLACIHKNNFGRTLPTEAMITVRP